MLVRYLVLKLQCMLSTHYSNEMRLKPFCFWMLVMHLRNSLNRLTVLLKICRLCPPLATVLINCYRAPTELFDDGDVLHSSEGITKGDPLAMPMYAIATTLLIKKLHCAVDDVNQVWWYAHDASATGKIPRLRQWWKLLSSQGPKFGYFANATKHG